MLLSMVCAVQCALAPLLLSAASVVPSWAHIGHSWQWIVIIFLIAIYSIGRGYLRHKKTSVVAFAVLGLSLLVIGGVYEHDLDVLAESIVFVVGGLSLTLAHWQNYRYSNRCNPKP